MIACSVYKWIHWKGLTEFSLKISVHCSFLKMSTFHVEEWVSVFFFKLARLHCTNNVVSVIPCSIIEEWLLHLLSKIKTSRKPTLWQIAERKTKQKILWQNSHLRRGDGKHMANCCLFNDNCKQGRNCGIFFSTQSWRLKLSLFNSSCINKHYQCFTSSKEYLFQMLSSKLKWTFPRKNYIFKNRGVSFVEEGGILSLFCTKPKQMLHIWHTTGRGSAIIVMCMLKMHIPSVRDHGALPFAFPLYMAIPDVSALRSVSLPRPEVGRVWRPVVER